MSETLKVDVINRRPELEQLPEKEQLLEFIDSDMKAFQEFFESDLGQNPPHPVERAYLKTYLAFKLLGREAMIKNIPT